MLSEQKKNFVVNTRTKEMKEKWMPLLGAGGLFFSLSVYFCFIFGCYFEFLTK